MLQILYGDTMASRAPGKRPTAQKERKTWRVGGRQKSPSPSPFDSDKKYRGATTYGNSSPLLGKSRGFNLPKRAAAGERDRTSTGDVSFGGTYRDRQRSMLQSVIRNLVDSNDEEERLAQRSKLESDLEVANERLDNLVQEHREKLHGTLATFKEVDSKVIESRDKLRRVKASLNQCKMSLRFKREELKRLWLEDIKYKHMLQTIQAIEEVRSVPDQLLAYTRRKHYLHATELLNNSVARMEGELNDIEALKDLKVELISQKEHLHEELIDELHRHLYVKATAKKSQSAAVQGGILSVSVSEGQPSPSPAKKTGTLTRRTQGHSRSASRSLTVDKMEVASGSMSPGSHSQQSGSCHGDEVVESLAPGVDPEDDSNHYMAILIESLSILGRVQDALDAIGSRMERELLLIIERASIQVQRISDQEAGFSGGRSRGVVRENQPKLLTKLLQMCFERFKNVVQAHGVLLGHLQRTRNVYRKAKFELYKESDVWAAIQRVLQMVLEIYLPFDDEGSPLDGLTGLAFSTPGDTQAVFARRKVVLRVTKKPLFRFESSRHAISVSSYMREQRDIELARGEEPITHSNRHFEEEQPSLSQHLVCKPHHHNITVVFGVMREFVLEVEEALALQPDDHCSLYVFLHELVEQDFLDRVRFDNLNKMTNCSKPESAKSLAPDQRTIQVTGSKQCVLNSVLSVWEVVEELRRLMKDVPMYSAHFLSILNEVLIGYRDSLRNLYKELTSGPSEGGVAGGGGARQGGSSLGAGQQDSIISSKWAHDDDIKRMIMSLGSWMKRQGRSKGTAAEELQAVYAKESEVLTKNIGSEPLRRNNVVLSHENLRMVAILHESMDWFNKKLKQLVFDLANQEGASSSIHISTDGGGMSMMRGVAEAGSISGYSMDDPERQNIDLMQQLSGIQSDFVNLADMTIIMLHLEVRCHCFYYLLPAVRKSSYILDSEAMQEDPNVRQLAGDLKDIDQVMVAVLSQEKYQYLFEGLGHLVASIFIASTQQMRVINSNGIKKMCLNISVLQSCLSKITLIREKDLDRARRYFEMLYLGFMDIIHQLMEQGTVYSQKDYVNAFKLMAQSASPPLSQDRLQEHIDRLDEVFSGDTV